MRALNVLASLAISVAAFGQMQDNQQKQLSCENGSYDSHRARHCEVREQSFATLGHLNVDAGQNGGTTVKGWLRNDVLVRARVEGWGETEGDANTMVSQVQIETSGGQVRASGPEAVHNAWWSVSFEIFVPQTTDLTLKTFNGGISLSDVRGNLQFEANNGGLALKRIAGEVHGSTVNGGVHIELAGNTWEGNQLQVTTQNGGVNISLPENYSAHIQTETVNGSVQSEFPITMQGESKLRHLDFNLGSGGPLIHVTTTNGGVKLKRT